jgi:hypothetical protein
MLLATSKKVTRKPIKFSGICAFARSQNVDRVHAYRVLTGRRESRRLLAAWNAFKKHQEAAR